jgi:hypothetical protein
MTGDTIAGALDHLAGARRWVAWRNELRGGKPSKMPYAPSGKKAKADDPSTWGTRVEAEARAAKIVNGQGGGVGIELGDLGGDIFLAGFDLDSCLADDRTLTSWARQILAAASSYTEVSPSGRGLKIFFYSTAKHVRPFLELVGVVNPEQRGFNRSIPEERSKANHGPGIELYFSGRFFTVTGKHWQSQPDKLTFLDWTALERLAQLIPRGVTALEGNAARDDSRSGVAFRKGAALRRAGRTFDEMVAELRKDPETAVWCREKGEAGGMRELRRIWDKAGSTNAPVSSTGPIIRVTAGSRHSAADQGLIAMHVASVPFFQRDRSLVRVCLLKAKASDGETISIPSITAVPLPVLGRALGQSARWEKVNSKNEAIPIDPPKEVAQQIAGMIGEWPFAPLAGVISTPTLRPDGSVLTAEGYDPATGLMLLAPPTTPPIPDQPSRSEAEEALALLNALLAEFPFADDASRSVALSMLLTLVLRGALVPAVPMHLVTAPHAGTGKSYLADLAATIATGERCPVMAMSPKPEETEKRLIGAALGGYPIIALDNCSDVLRGDFLCQVTERPILQLRALGTSALVRVPNSFTTFANGNNATVADDLVRRTLSCRLDADMENPEERLFRRDPVAIVKADRGRYVGACLTIARSYIAHGRPARLRPLPSFEGWSDTVRSPLVWLGRSDPAETIATARGDDPARLARAEVFSTWAAELGINESGYLSVELADLAEERHEHSGTWLRPALRNALLSVARYHNGESRIDARRLGIWLRRASNNIAGGYKLIVNQADAARPRWILTRK